MKEDRYKEIEMITTGKESALDVEVKTISLANVQSHRVMITKAHLLVEHGAIATKMKRTKQKTKSAL